MRTLITIIFSFILYTVCQAQDKRLAGIENDIVHLMDTFHTVGLAVVVVENNKIIYSKGFGYTDLKNKIPVTTNSLFGIGSVTKQFTAALVGIYEDRKNLSVYDRPSEYITGLEFYTNMMDSLITIEDLLTHRSGIGNCDAAMVFFPTKDHHKNALRVRYLKPSGQVRQSFDYSNMGYSILGAITENMSQKKWEEVLKEEIFDPLGMDRSNASIEDNAF